MVYKNIYEYNKSFDYPNYAFPSEYTKGGQQQLKDQWSQGSGNISTQNISQDTYLPPTQSVNTSKLNITTLLPLIKAMSSKGKINSSDMIKTIMPLLGNNSSNVAELISAFNNIVPAEKTHQSKIESYVKVDDLDKKTPWYNHGESFIILILIAHMQ